MTYRIPIVDRETLALVTTVEVDDLDRALAVATYWRDLGMYTRVDLVGVAR